MTAFPPLSEKVYGFAIVGCGMIAGFHARALAKIPNVRLVGVASRSLERAQRFAREHVLPLATDSVAELAARPDIDIICIATSSGAHLEPALQAMRGGKHVIVEKPLEITVERMDEMLRAAAAAGVRIGAVFQGRFGDGARTVKAALDRGRIGRLVFASASVKWHRTAQYYTGTRGTFAADGGGALMAQAIHAVDLLQWFAGVPREVYGMTSRCVHTGIEAEDNVAAALRFAGGALGTIEASTAVWPGWQRRIEICGDRGSVALEDDRIARWEFAESGPDDAAVLAASGGAALGSGAAAPNAISELGHRRQFADFVGALREGRAPAIDGNEARKAVVLIRALYESAARGVSVTPFF